MQKLDLKKKTHEKRRETIWEEERNQCEGGQKSVMG
jgi:hypothetical protein